jgi:hypothetical protein
MEAKMSFRDNASPLSRRSVMAVLAGGITVSAATSQAKTPCQTGITTNFDSNVIGAVAPEVFGAIGDGHADDTDAFERAIASGRLIACRAGSTYLISRPLIARAGSALAIWGGVVRGSGTATLKVAQDFKGILLQPSGAYDIRGLKIVGNGRDGCILFGNMGTGTSNFSILDTIDFRDAELFVYFSSNWEHPLGLSYSRIYGQGFRTAGIVIGGTEGDARSGESAWQFNQIIMTNNASQIGRTSLAAEKVRVTHRHTSDQITCDLRGIPTAMFGWMLMRSQDSGRNWHVADVSPIDGVVQYVFNAPKREGEDWQYVVLRQTVGISLRRGKVVSCSCIQAEYCGIGLAVSRIAAISVDTFYYESRGDSKRLTPSFAAIQFDRSYGNISTAWIEEAGYGIYVTGNSHLSGGVIRGNRIKWSLINDREGTNDLMISKPILSNSDGASLHRRAS